MKNGDQPIHPTESATMNGTEFINHSVKDGRKYGGLTKREYFAAMMMQGMLSNTNIGNALRNEGVSAGDVDRQISITSIRLADELLAQLETK